MHFTLTNQIWLATDMVHLALRLVQFIFAHKWNAILLLWVLLSSYEPVLLVLNQIV